MSKINTMQTRGRKVLFIGLIIGFVLVLTLAISWKLFRGQGIRMRLTHRLKALLNRSSVEREWSPALSVHGGEGDFTDVIFLHHSTGRNLIRQGGVRELLAEAGFQFWDHDYNWEGLIRPDGARAGYSYVIPDDNTDPDGLARLFAQPVYSWPLNGFSGLMQHEVIAFKSCFPASDITTDEQLEQYKNWYLEMREVMNHHPDHIFIVVTPPPLNPAAATPEAAARAHTFAEWLQSDDFLMGHPNVFTFDFFGHLAESDPSAAGFGMLRADYREGADSHPNELANQTIGPPFADFIGEAVQTYRDYLARGSS